ncbi:MAG: DUF3500 domain-containing protein [Rubripirellula sp.]
MRFARATLLASALIGCVFVAGWKVGDPPGKQMQAFADSFIGSLDEQQKAVAVLPYDTPKRVGWHFIPMKTRKGLVMREMNAAQRVAALRLVRAALSEAGYDKASKIMLLEGVLRELEGEGRNWERDPEKYFVTIFGTPSETDAWGLSFEGHHLSLNFVCRGGRVVDSTPQFFAANPGTIMEEVSGPLGKGTRVLREEEDLAFKLVNSLNEIQGGEAIIDEKAPKEIRFAGEPQSDAGEPEGIAQRTLNADQKALLQELVYVYANAVADDVAEQRREQIEHDGWGDVHFAWAGATKPGIGHYYRIQGANFLIEFVNTQADAAGNPANHIHSVYRDLSGDFDLPIK